MRKSEINNEFLILCVSGILLAVLLCYFGVNNFINNTYAVADTGYVCSGNLQVNNYLGTPVCCPSSSDKVVKASDGKYYCLGINEIEGAQVGGGHAFTSVEIINSTPYCSVTVDKGAILESDSTVCPGILGNAWSTIDGSCTVNALTGKVCACKASLSTCSAREAGNVSCSNGGVLTDSGCVKKTCYYCGKDSSFVWVNEGYQDSVMSCTLRSEYTTEASCIANNSIYTITYKANGGTGEPAIQQKRKNENLILSDQVPVRDGYVFKGWGKSSTATTVSYQPGETYSENVSRVLYAIWEKRENVKYNIIYNKNGGTGSMSNTECTNGCTIMANGFTRSNCGFDGWNTKSDGSGKDYSSGQKISSLNADLTLYAQWVCNSSSKPSSSTNSNEESSKPSSSSSSSSNKPSSSSSSTSMNNSSSSTSSNVNNDVGNNPQTGSIAIFIVWIIGFVSIGYSMWYFKKVKEN